jgi:hypothetical protein
MISLELGTTHNPFACPCCGETSVNLSGFVYRDGDARAVYWAGMTAGHERRVIEVAVGIGEWGDGTSAADRIGFVLQLWAEGSQPNVTIVSPDESRWNTIALLGRILPREEALRHSFIKEVFHITDHLVTDDPRIGTYLQSGLLPPPKPAPPTGA